MALVDRLPVAKTDVQKLEVADDAGIARKWRVTALTTAQYVGVCVNWVAST